MRMPRHREMKSFAKGYLDWKDSIWLILLQALLRITTQNCQATCIRSFSSLNGGVETELGF